MIPLDALRRAHQGFSRTQRDMRAISEPAEWWHPFVFGAFLILAMEALNLLAVGWFGG